MAKLVIFCQSFTPALSTQTINMDKYSASSCSAHLRCPLSSSSTYSHSVHSIIFLKKCNVLWLVHKSVQSACDRHSRNDNLFCCTVQHMLLWTPCQSRCHHQAAENLMQVCDNHEQRKRPEMNWLSRKNNKKNTQQTSSYYFDVAQDNFLETDIICLLRLILQCSL